MRHIVRIAENFKNVRAVDGISFSVGRGAIQGGGPVSGPPDIGVLPGMAAVYFTVGLLLYNKKTKGVTIWKINCWKR